MAHQTEIVVNGQTVEVTEFDHTAQEIDDMCDAAQSILPDGPGLPVSQGGTGATTPQAALAALGAGVRPNLLINPFFQVNQRGQTSYTAAGYTVDGWKTTAEVKVDVVSNGIKLTATGSRNFAFTQRLENPLIEDTLLTTSVAVTEVSGEFIMRIRDSDFGSYGNSIVMTSPGVYKISATVPAGKIPMIQFYPNAQGYSAVLCAAKFEEGDTQTLAYQDEDGAWQLLPQPESDYATQLAKCQRYQLKLPYGSSQNFAPVGFGWALNASSVRILIPTPITMRTSPAISYLSGDINGITIVSNGKNIVPNSITQIIVMNYGVAIEFAVSGADNSMPCVMRTTSAYLLLDANL